MLEMKLRRDRAELEKYMSKIDNGPIDENILVDKDILKMIRKF